MSGAVQQGSQDGFRWISRQCHQRASVRNNSFLSLGKLVWMLLSWESDTPDISKQMLVDWDNFIRDVCTEDSRRNPVQLEVSITTTDPSLSRSMKVTSFIESTTAGGS